MAIENKSYDEFCKFLNKRIDFKESIMIEIELENLGMKDKTLEDFLEGEGIFQRMSKTEKLEKVEELKNFYSKRRGSGASEKSKLLESYRIILNDVNKEKEYDNYLKKIKYSGVNQILKNSKEVYKRDGRLKLNQIENYVSQINLKIKNESDARNIFYGFCRQEGIPFNPKRNYQNEENRQENWKPRNSSNSNKNTPEEDHKNTWKNRENSNEWNPNREKASSGNIAVWVIGGVLILLLVVVIWNQNKKSDMPSVTQAQPVPQSQPQPQPQPQPQQSESQPQQDQKPETYDENNQSNSDNENNENQNGENEEKQQENTYVSLDNVSDLSDLNDRVDKIEKKVLNGDEDTLNNYSKFGLQLIRNSFYAKYGYNFQKNQDMIDYFQKLQGYDPDNDDDESIEQNFSEDDKRFIKIVKSKEN